MSTGLVRGACPGLSAPMQTGDGLLVRLTPKGTIEIDAFIAFCALARRHGNGATEISARGNLQVRGLTTQSAPTFAAEVTDLQIASTCRVPLITDPLPDDPDTLIDVGRLAAELSRAIADSRWTLAPKVSVTIDGGSRLHLDAVPADVRLRVTMSAKGPLLHVALGGEAGTATALGAIAPNDAADVTIRLLAVIARHGTNARATDILAAEGIAPFTSAVADRLETAPGLPARSPAESIGLHALRGDRLALGVGLAFGQADAEMLSRLAAIARDCGAGALRPAPGRALLLLGLDDSAAESVTAAAAQLGFVTSVDDPRRGVAACAGKPACASAWLATRTLAAAVARRLPGSSGGVALHISGCAKGCAHPAPAALTVIGDARGAGIVRNGPASAPPLRYVAPENLLAEITHLMLASEVSHG